MKQKNSKQNSQSGFTLVELLVVLAIMTLITATIVIDFTRQRGQRNLVLAKNEAITNIRKVQSYMLSSKNITPSNDPAKFYIITFDLATPHIYKVQAVSKDYEFYDNVETINLPTAVNISQILTTPDVIDFGPPPIDDSEESDGMGDAVLDGGELNEQSAVGSLDFAGDLQEDEPVDIGGIADEDPNSHQCIQIIFSAPFGKMYTNGTSNCTSSIKDTLKDPVKVAGISEKRAQIYFTDTSGSGATVYIELDPVTGQMTAH
jgi:prepilin-type N-terminal cleavage/methylation domain-containing protein